jgi:hypothetical protein
VPKTRDSDETKSLLDDLRDGLRIDKNDLDNALMDQPDAYWRVSEAYVMACSRRDEMKYDIEQASAELDKQFRREAEKSDEKLTEKSLTAQIETSPKIITLRKEYAQMRLKADLLSAMKESYADRSKALRELSQLYSSNYFTVNTGSRARDEAGDRRVGDIREQAGRQRQERPLRTRKGE